MGAYQDVPPAMPMTFKMGLQACPTRRSPGLMLRRPNKVDTIGDSISFGC